MNFMELKIYLAMQSDTVITFMALIGVILLILSMFGLICWFDGFDEGPRKFAQKTGLAALIIFVLLAIIPKPQTLITMFALPPVIKGHVAKKDLPEYVKALIQSITDKDKATTKEAQE